MGSMALSDVCWLWTGIRYPKGYGEVTIHKVPKRAHRYVYELLVGPVPEGKVLDHICRQRGCVNPAHLRVVSHRENLHAKGSKALAAKNTSKTHCPHGHEYTEENTYTHAGRRHCWTCKKARRRAELDRNRKSFDTAMYNGV
jgi:hypothetical protein